MKSQINVTPIIDVMLVLLIIFMVVTPLTQKGIDVELPSTASGRERGAARALVLEADERGSLRLNRQPIGRDALPLTLRDALELRSDKTLFLRAHEKLRYGEVVALLGVAKASGVERVGIVQD